MIRDDLTLRVWLTVDEASHRTGVSKTEIYAAVRAAELVASQRNKHAKWRIHVDDIDTWMRNQRVAS